MSEGYGVYLTHIAEVEGLLGGVPDAEEGGGAEEVFRHLHLWFFVAFVSRSSEKRRDERNVQYLLVIYE